MIARMTKTNTEGRRLRALLKDRERLEWMVKREACVTKMGPNRFMVCLPGGPSYIFGTSWRKAITKAMKFI